MSLLRDALKRSIVSSINRLAGRRVQNGHEASSGQMTQLSELHPSQQTKIAAKEQLGEWRPLEDGRGLEMFSNSDYCFDVRVNLDFHARNFVRVDWHPDISDYSDIFDDALETLRQSGGGTLLLSAGEFLHSRQIILPSYTCLRGMGRDSTTVKVADYSAPFPVAGAIRAKHGERVSICDLTQDGNCEKQHLRTTKEQYGRYGIYTHLVNYVWMSGVRVRGNYAYAFDPHGSKKHWAYFLVIENCVSEGNGLDGFTIDQTMYVSLLRSTGFGNARHGVNIVTGSRVVLVKGCTFESNGERSGKGFGMCAQNNDTRGKFGTRDVIFEGNVVKRCQRGCAVLRDVQGVISRNNALEGLQGTVIYELNATMNTQLADTVLENGAQRIKHSNGASFTDQSYIPYIP